MQFAGTMPAGPYLDSYDQAPSQAPLHTLLAIAGGSAFAGGAFALLGRWINVVRLTDWDGSGISMLPNTALAACLAGAALVLLARNQLKLAVFLGLLTGLIGGATLFEHLANISLGIDTALLHREWGQSNTASPGRMGPPAASAYTVVGAAIVLAALKRGSAVVSTLGMLVLSIAMVSVTGRLFGAGSLYTLPHLTAIAVPTSIILLFLGVGLLASVPAVEPVKSLRGNSAAAMLMRRALSAIILIPVALGWLRVWTQDAGLLSFPFGAALRTLVEIFLLMGLLWWAARAVRSHEDALRAREGDLRVQSARLAAVIESSDDAIVSKGLDGVITSWNRSAERMFGFGPPEAVGKHITIIIPPERWPEETEVLARIRRGEKVDHFETERQAKDGRRLIISLTVSPIRDETGRIIGASKVARDITDRRRAEADRAALLESERAARAQAERAGRLKDDFLATLSHELRTPLNAVLGWASILRKSPPSPETLEQGLTVIDRNARMQAQLIADLLDMSRIISGKMRLDVQPVQLAVVIEAALDAVRPAATAKEVRILSVIEPISEAIYGDPTRLQQVIWNLLSNAVKFTPRGGRVQIVSSRVNSHIEISVSDTGQGIKAEFLPHVFERFRQADSSPARGHGGLGLGLAIVKQLVELHGGTVHVESQGEGKGSNFVVELPLSIVQPRAREVEGVHPTAESLSPRVTCSPNLAGIRVLVLDDEQDAREVVRRVLEECEADVILAGSAAEALETVKKSIPNVILSDIGLPGQDGYEFMKAVRQMGIDAPAAALTAFARSEDRMRALQAGYQTHIAKPVEPSELLAAVASLANRTRPRDAKS